MSLRTPGRTAVLGTVLGLIVGAIAVLFTPTAAVASHFRATQLNWHTTSTSNEVEFHLTTSVRCTIFFDDGSGNCNGVAGDTFGEYNLDFGDLDATFVNWEVVSVDVANDVVNAEAHVVHQYAAAGDYTAVLSGCCRLGSSNGHQNNGDGDLVTSALVHLGPGTTASPVSQVSPIIDCPADTNACLFQVPATDLDGHTLSWRLAGGSDPEVSTGFVQPTGASISSSGLYAWDTTGITPPAGENWYYSTIVIVEARNGTGTLVGRIAVDFFLRIGDSTNAAPVFNSPTPADGTTINATVGSPVTFSTNASDPDSGDTVTLGMIGKPGTATYATSPGNPATGSFSWTPAATGTTILTLTAADQQGRQAVQRSITIVVGQGTSNEAPEAEAGGPYSGTEGSPIAVNGSGHDHDGDALTYAWSYTGSLDAGASCSFADAADPTTTITCTDDGVITATLTVDDGQNPPVTDAAQVTVSNAAPTVSINTPIDATTGTTYGAGSSVALTAPSSDAGSNDTRTCSIGWGDGSSSTGTVSGAGVCSSSHTWAAAGVYTVTVTITDDEGATGTASVDVNVIVARSAKVTGGGFINEGGRTSFGLNAHDDGTLFGQIQVRSAKNRFHGSTVSGLTVSGKTATWSGTGKWNGVAGATFTVTVVDNGQGGSKKGSPDTFSITIRNASGAVVHTASGALKGGNLTVH